MNFVQWHSIGNDDKGQAALKLGLRIAKDPPPPLAIIRISTKRFYRKNTLPETVINEEYIRGRNSNISATHSPVDTQDILHHYCH